VKLGIMRTWPGCEECARLREAWVAIEDDPRQRASGVPASWGPLLAKVAAHRKQVHSWPPGSDEPMLGGGVPPSGGEPPDSSPVPVLLRPSPGGLTSRCQQELPEEEEHDDAIQKPTEPFHHGTWKEPRAQQPLPMPRELNPVYHAGRLCVKIVTPASDWIRVVTHPALVSASTARHHSRGKQLRSSDYLVFYPCELLPAN